MNVWVLTGDKQETAINIGLTSRLIGEDTELIVVNAAQSMDACRHALEKALSAYVDSGAVKRKKHALVIDGGTLHKCMDPLTKKTGGVRGAKRQENPLLPLIFQLGSAVSSVICCRVTPLQKAMVVRMVKKMHNGSVCLSIGT